MNSKISLQDCIDICSPKIQETEYVVITIDDAPTDMFMLAKAGGFLTHLGGEYYRCKRTVADNLTLPIISDWPIIHK